MQNEENLKTKIYYGVRETTFKPRYVNHKKHSVTSNIKLMQNYQMNTGILYQQTELRTYLGNFENQEIIQPKF